MKEYVYRDRKTGEILFSREKIEDPELEYLGEIEVKAYGGGRTTGTADTGDTEEEA